MTCFFFSYKRVNTSWADGELLQEILVFFLLKYFLKSGTLKS